jgi:N-acetylneuraminic acid mutarotase
LQLVLKKKNMKSLLLKPALLFLLLTLKITATAQWTSIAPVYAGAIANDGAVSFTIGNTGYIVAGSSTSAFYSYDTLANSWTQVGNIPDNAGHAFAMSFVINNKAYIVGGDTGGVPLATVWEFDPSASGNQWTQKNNFPAGTRDAGFSFAIGNYGYAGAGFDGSSIYSDIWKYDPANDHWTQLSVSLPVSGLIFPTTFTITNKGYILTGGLAPSGVNEIKNMWCIDGSNDSLSAKSDFPGVGRQAAFSFSNGLYGFAGGGQAGYTTNFNDMYMYDPLYDQWTPVPDAPMLGAAWSSAFVIGNTAYAGLGAKFVGAGLTGTDAFWKFNMDISTGIPSHEKSNLSFIYNETEHALLVKHDRADLLVSAFDISGKRVLNKNVGREEYVKLECLTPGIFLVRLQEGSEIYSGKIFIR